MHVSAFFQCRTYILLDITYSHEHKFHSLQKKFSRSLPEIVLTPELLGASARESLFWFSDISSKTNQTHPEPFFSCVKYLSVRAQVIVNINSLVFTIRNKSTFQITVLYVDSLNHQITESSRNVNITR